MKLREVFTKPKGKIKWATKTAKKWVGDYSVGDRDFKFEAFKGIVDDSELHPYEDKVDKKTLVAAKEFVKGAKPAYIYFSAKEPSRMKLYNIMVKKLASSMGFKVLNASQGNYLLQSKR